uniref:Rod shape-determining protein MreD n=1 Tax=Elaeophora elaphi TaxID=1147741 RepID=A0A0R3RPY7_9BILA
MLIIAGIIIATAIKTHIALVIIDGLTGDLISFILIFTVWISGILAIFAYTHKRPLLIWPFIVFLVSYDATNDRFIFINMLIIAFLIYFTVTAIPANISAFSYFIAFFMITGIQAIMLLKLYIAFRWYISTKALQRRGNRN